MRLEAEMQSSGGRKLGMSKHRQIPFHHQALLTNVKQDVLRQSNKGKIKRPKNKMYDSIKQLMENNE